MKICRAVLVAAVLSCSLSAFAQSAAKADPAYPSRPITLIVAFPAGAGADLTARTIAQKLTESLGQPVVVDNRAGANGILGTSTVAKAAPDGYTILLTDRGALGINPNIYKSLAYDPLKDFEYITIAVTGAYVLAVKNDLPVKSFEELVGLARSKPGVVNYASFGVGSMPQLNMEAFKARQGINLTHIPYKGGAPAAAALLAGEVDVAPITAPSLVGPLKSGKVRALAVGSAKRVALLPEVPTMIEVGGGDDTFVPTYFGFAAPAGTPRAIVDKLNAEIRKALAQKDLVERLAGAGLEAAGSSSEEMAATVKRDIARFGMLVKAIGIEPE
ncbi:MAG: tripartite tricarboxylate transporter substrate binding protein [Betaproteobacteria bacterium]